MFRIFKEFTSHLETYQGDLYALALNLIGGLIIGITFLVIGIIFIAIADKDYRDKRKKRITTLFGLFLISCSFSRFLSVLCIWHNYAILDGWVKLLTGLLAFSAIIYLPKAIEQTLSERKLLEAQRSLQKTQEDLTEVKKLSERLIDNK